jgi:hypothetical protein
VLFRAFRTRNPNQVVKVEWERCGSAAYFLSRLLRQSLPNLTSTLFFFDSDHESIGGPLSFAVAQPFNTSRIHPAKLIANTGLALLIACDLATSFWKLEGHERRDEKHTPIQPL